MFFWRMLIMRLTFFIEHTADAKNYFPLALAYAINYFPFAEVSQ
jgi:hypothetical protein